MVDNSTDHVKFLSNPDIFKLFFIYPVSCGRSFKPFRRAAFLNKVVLVSQSGFTAFVQRRLDTVLKVSWGELWN